MTESRHSDAERLLLVTTALAVLHHIDHVLRSVHSGWPFLAEVTSFTYGLLVYPVIAVVLLARGWPRLRIGLTALLAASLAIAHVMLETPADQYVVWAARPEWNWLAVGSPVAGALSVLVSVLLALAGVATVVAFIRSGGA
jgi:hypothetical protein